MNFEASLVHVSGKRAFHTGTPLRKALKNVSDQRGKAFLGLQEDSSAKPILLVVGGSLGAASINQLIFNAIDKLIEDWTVVHVLGAAGIKEAPEKNGYLAFEYIGDEFAIYSRLRISSSVEQAQMRCMSCWPQKITRADSTWSSASRGDQLQNAALFEKAGCSAVLHEQDATVEALRSP